MIGAIIGGVSALGSSIFGGIKSAHANKKADRLLKGMRDENKRWHDVRMSQDYTQRADVQATIKRQRELMDEQYERALANNRIA